MTFDTSHIQMELDFSADAEIVALEPVFREEECGISDADFLTWQAQATECFRHYTLASRPLLPLPEGGFISDADVLGIEAIAKVRLAGAVE